MGAVLQISRGAFKHVEAELYNYQHTKKEISKLRNEIMYPFDNEREDTPIVKGANSVRKPGDPTARVATLLAANKTLRNLEEITDAIDSVYSQLDPSHQKLIRLRYWSGRKPSWDEVALTCGFGERSVYRHRDCIVQAIAERIGWR